MTSLVLLPGICGSELDDVVHGQRSLLWVDVQKLATNSIDLSLFNNADVRPKRPLMNAPGFGDVYGDFTAKLKPHGIAYDWRKSLDDSAKYVLHDLASVPGELDIVTHSMGGCVLAHAFAQDESLFDRIKHVVFVAPPFFGALEPLAKLANGTSGGVIERFTSLIVAQQAAIVRSWPGIFDLLVAPEHIWPDDVNGKRVRYPLSGPSLDIYDVRSWLGTKPQGLSERLDDTRRRYRLLPGLLSEIEAKLGHRLSIVVGMNGETAFDARREPNGTDFILDHPHQQARAPWANGDGTVLLESSVIPGMDLTRLFGIAVTDDVNPHATLLRVPLVQSTIRRILADDDSMTTGGRLYRGADVISATDVF